LNPLDNTFARQVKELMAVYFRPLRVMKMTVERCVNQARDIEPLLNPVEA
jgi:hypothetical protein